MACGLASFRRGKEGHVPFLAKQAMLKIPASLLASHCHTARCQPPHRSENWMGKDTVEFRFGKGKVRVKPSWRTTNLFKLQHRWTPTAKHKQKHSCALLESERHRAPALQSGVHGEPWEMGRREQVLVRPGASKVGNLATHFLCNPGL